MCHIVFYFLICQDYKGKKISIIFTLSQATQINFNSNLKQVFWNFFVYHFSICIPYVKKNVNVYTLFDFNNKKKKAIILFWSTC